MSDWIPTDSEYEPDDSFQQRAEELYLIQNAEADEEGIIECPVVFLREVVVLPQMVSPIFVTPGHNLTALTAIRKTKSTLVTLIQKDGVSGDITIDQFLPIGVEAAAGRLLSDLEGNNSTLLQGRRRVRIIEFSQFQPYCIVRAQVIDEGVNVDHHVDALMRTTRHLFEECVQLDRSLPDEAHLYSMNITEPAWLADMIGTALSLPFSTRQELLLAIDPIKRLRKINRLLAEELDVLKLEADIQQKVQTEVDKSQREYYLREQIKAIQNELGEGDVWISEINELRQAIQKKGLSDEGKARAEKELDRLSQMPQMAPEVGILRTYIDWLLDLPWSECTQDNLDVQHAAKILERDHYGLKRVKERILEYIAVLSLHPKKPRQPILCFVGPPGTGKTSLGKSIAEALGRNFIRVSLGGVRDEAEIRGHRRTYIGAMPGRILQTMKRAGTNNPLFMLDEIDKLGNDYRGDPSSALLEVLDPEQNFSFSDHYLELPYDLSKVLFITTANNIAAIPEPLLDRMEVIDFVGYLEEEKMEIASHYLIPRQLMENGLDEDDVKFHEAALRKVIAEYTYEAGVRNLEREIGRIFRKIARQKSEKKDVIHRITPVLVEKFLGPPQFFINEAERDDEIGVATAIAWTENGGDIMPLEVALMDGKGNLQITGQIGDVMQESVQAALSYIKARAKKFHIKKSRFETIDIHLHVPEGAIPKDGPSAGITIAAALLSAFTDRPIYHQVGLTGEITLRGRVLPIGGVREKILAAHRAGLKKVILPSRNKKDIIDLPRKALLDIELCFVSTMDEVIDIALHPELEKKSKKVSSNDSKE